MGAEVSTREFTREDRRRFREQVGRGTDAIARMLADGLFTDAGRQVEPLLGMEVELNLIDRAMNPAMSNATVLQAIADPEFQTELGQFNIEINVAPRPLTDDNTIALEQALRASLNRAEQRAAATDNHIVMIGMLPTLRTDHLRHQWISANPRYGLLNEQIFASRGEDIALDIDGIPLGDERVEHDGLWRHARGGGVLAAAWLGRG